MNVECFMGQWKWFKKQATKQNEHKQTTVYLLCMLSLKLHYVELKKRILYSYTPDKQYMQQTMCQHKWLKTQQEFKKEKDRYTKMKQSCTVNAANDGNQTGIWHTVKQTSRAKQSQAELTVIRPTSFIFGFLLICLSILHLCCPKRCVTSSFQLFLK